MIAGTFAFRFSGFSVDGNDEQYYLVGVGIMQLHNDGSVSGSQRSTITKLVGSGCKLQRSHDTMAGTYQFAADGTGAATITFTSVDQVLEGTFDFVRVDADRFWMISSGARIMSSEGILADEVVSGEAVRMPAG